MIPDPKKSVLQGLETLMRKTGQKRSNGKKH